MKSLFPGYYRPSDDEFKKLWAEAVVSFDTNVLLNLYRLDKASSVQFLAAIKKFGGRVWLPYQVAKEFVNKRVEVIRDRLAVYNEVKNEVANAVEQLKKPVLRNPNIPVDKLHNLYDGLLNDVLAELEKTKQAHPDPTHNDPISDELDRIFAGKIGAKPKDKEHDDAIKECEKRFAKNVPPGNEDKPKGGEKQYGDAILWLQLLANAETTNKPVILVTDDSKKDWWHMVGGNTVGPRPELMQEMWDGPKVPFYLYRSSRFLELALKDEPGKEKAVQDVKVVEQTPEPVVIDGRKDESYYGLVRDAFARDYLAAALAGVPSYKDIMGDQFRGWNEALRAAMAAQNSVSPIQEALAQAQRSAAAIYGFPELTKLLGNAIPNIGALSSATETVRAAREAARAAKEAADLAETAKRIQKDVGKEAADFADAAKQIQKGISDEAAEMAEAAKQAQKGLNDIQGHLKGIGRAPKKPAKPEVRSPLNRLSKRLSQRACQRRRSRTSCRRMKVRSGKRSSANTGWA